MRRAVGILAALLILGAGIAIRFVRSGGDDDGQGDVQRVVCATDLAELCDGIPGVEIESPGTTFATLTQRTAEPVVWITLDPWTAMVDDERSRAGLAPLFSETVEVASTPMVYVGWTDRLDAAADACGLTWSCLSSADRWDDLGGSSSWQRVSLGLDDPAGRAQSIAGLGWIGSITEGGSLREAADELATFARRRRAGGADVIGNMLLTGPAGVDVAPAPEALAGVRVSVAQNQVPELRRGDGPRVAIVVGGAAPGSVTSSVERAAFDVGWGADGGGSGLTGGEGVALWLAWDEVR